MPGVLLNLRKCLYSHSGRKLKPPQVRGRTWICVFLSQNVISFMQTTDTLQIKSSVSNGFTGGLQRLHCPGFSVVAIVLAYLL